VLNKRSAAVARLRMPGFSGTACGSSRVKPSAQPWQTFVGQVWWRRRVAWRALRSGRPAYTKTAGQGESVHLVSVSCFLVETVSPGKQF
jgi:hypothetical protein